MSEMSDWISVKDRLPEDGEKVLIFDTYMAHGSCGSGVQVAVFQSGELFKDGNNKTPYEWFADGGPMSWYGQCVTHWMPLPEMPKEKKQVPADGGELGA